MVNMENIANIKNRIADIQARFGIPQQLPGADFGAMLQKEMQRAKESEKVSAENSVTAAGSLQDPHQTAAQMMLPSTDGTVSSQSFANMVAEAARKYEVDPKLLSAVAEAESGGDQSAVSPAGAVGVMQLMPDTAASLGVDPYDEKQNIEGGAKYLRQMLDSFGGDVRKAVAAYNAGPQAVHDYGGVPPYRETQSYVNRVLDLYQ
ncbi:MAG: lytic transglycosylase domain-containing protein [Selenomonadaceae bacterium]|nr:lytic transglycosylase domain-containing protein [Selenomonadaceae bacterium]